MKLYSIFRERGERATLYRVGSVSVNRETGEETRNTSTTKLRRVVVLDSSLFEKIMASVVGNQGVRTGQRIFLISKREISKILDTDYLFYKDTRYDITKLEHFENEAWIVTTQITQNDSHNQVHDMSVYQMIAFNTL